MVEERTSDPQSSKGRDSAIARRWSKHNDQETNAAVWVDLVAGGIAGTAGIVVGHPFDTIKVRLQQQHRHQPQPRQPSRPKSSASKRSLAATKTSSGTAQTSLYRGLFRGIGAPLATAALVNANIFCVYGSASRFWDRHHSTADEETVQKQLFCGAASGFCTSLLVCPIELVKVQLQTQTLQKPGDVAATSVSVVSKANSSWSLAKQIVRSGHGFRGLYRGLTATMLRQTPSLTVYFPTYHTLREFLQEDNNDETHGNNSAWWSSALAGGLAGSLAWAVVYPADVIKSRIQSMPLSTSGEQNSLRTVAHTTLRGEGYVRLMLSRGLAVTLMRAFPVNGTIFFVYEQSSKRL
eukprot:jgi/Psemu1/227989/e_gw1.2210.3.1